MVGRSGGFIAVGLLFRSRQWDKNFHLAKLSNSDQAQITEASMRVVVSLDPFRRWTHEFEAVDHEVGRSGASWIDPFEAVDHEWWIPSEAVDPVKWTPSEAVDPVKREALVRSSSQEQLPLSRKVAVGLHGDTMELSHEFTVALRATGDRVRSWHVLLVGSTQARRSVGLARLKRLQSRMEEENKDNATQNDEHPVNSIPNEAEYMQGSLLKQPSTIVPSFAAVVSGNTAGGNVVMPMGIQNQASGNASTIPSNNQNAPIQKGNFILIRVNDVAYKERIAYCQYSLIARVVLSKGENHGSKINYT
ncbi:hypothetical protein FNV43_RR13014 [Rhamnella rubrinervis]|uniref:Uncharacterized protein n=1 Tax=Rhamnella rubrinervis TaxID=2594499 RepID=A0A8K0MEK4_9ROSA|nr:hypothetical protein FNV43_RR13014 [Rhamnella rubrinervis]